MNLYTKDPSRENLTALQISADTRASSRVQVIDAKKISDYSFLANLDISKNSYEKYDVNQYQLSRDGLRGQLYFNISDKDNFDIELGATNEKYDIFNGFGSSPLEGDINTKNIYLQISKYFSNNLKIIADAARESLHVYNKDAAGIKLFDNSLSNDLRFKVLTNVYNLIIEKKFITSDNELFIGAQMKHKKFDAYEFNYDNANYTPAYLNIFMIDLEDMYNIDENNLITVGAKLDHYRNNYSKSSTEHILRAGYVALFNKELTLKLFATKSYQYPIFTQTTFSPIYKSNYDLKSVSMQIYTGELTYSLNNTTLNFGGVYSKADDVIVYNKKENRYVNSETDGSSKKLFIKAIHKLDINNKFTIEYFRVFQDKYFSPDYGLQIQIMNKLGKFDIYNELIYRSKYTSPDVIEIDAGYDYTLGVIYPLSKDIELKLKGENLLERASTVPINGIEVQAVERRALLTMEYIF